MFIDLSFQITAVGQQIISTYGYEWDFYADLWRVYFPLLDSSFTAANGNFYFNKQSVNQDAGNNKYFNSSMYFGASFALRSFDSTFVIPPVLRTRVNFPDYTTYLKSGSKYLRCNNDWNNNFIRCEGIKQFNGVLESRRAFNPNRNVTSAKISLLLASGDEVTLPVSYVDNNQI